ncbi:MAG: EI24 domain-containing protein [Proteobacteria bacterium]|nr:EI24 domain-containing protein [Pseudomonadota bacterium]
MIRAFAVAIAQLGDPKLGRLLSISVLAAILVFAGLWIGIGWLLHETRLFELIWLEGAFDILGGFATLILTWMLFPAVMGAVIGFLLEDVAVVVEARYYPHEPPAKPVPGVESAFAGLRFLRLAVGLNLLVLFFLFVPPLFPFVFYGVNGYLLSREYFEVVALRRASRAEVESLWRTHRLQIVALGVGTAIFLTIPLVNLIAPVVATAALVHLLEGWRRKSRPVQ